MFFQTVSTVSGSDWSQDSWSFWGAFGTGRLVTVGDRESLHIAKTVKRVKHDCPWLPEAITFKWSVNKVKPKGLKKVKNCQFNIGNRADMFRQCQILKLSKRIRSHRKSTPAAMTLSLLFGFQPIFILHKCKVSWHLWQMSTGTQHKEWLLGNTLLQVSVQEDLAARGCTWSVKDRTGLRSPWNGQH